MAAIRPCSEKRNQLARDPCTKLFGVSKYDRRAKVYLGQKIYILMNGEFFAENGIHRARE